MTFTCTWKEYMYHIFWKLFKINTHRKLHMIRTFFCVWKSKWHSLHNSVLDRKCLHFMWLRYNSKKHLFSCFFVCWFFVCVLFFVLFLFFGLFVCLFVCLFVFFFFVFFSSFFVKFATYLNYLKKSSSWHFFSVFNS